MISLGRRVEIRPAYSSETREQDIWDELAGCAGVVVGYGREGSGDHVVELLGPGGEEHVVHVGQLRQLERED